MSFALSDSTSREPESTEVCLVKGPNHVFVLKASNQDDAAINGEGRRVFLLRDGPTKNIVIVRRLFIWSEDAALSRQARWQYPEVFVSVRNRVLANLANEQLTVNGEFYCRRLSVIGVLDPPRQAVTWEPGRIDSSLYADATSENVRALVQKEIRNSDIDAISSSLSRVFGSSYARDEISQANNSGATADDDSEALGPLPIVHWRWIVVVGIAMMVMGIMLAVRGDVIRGRNGAVIFVFGMISLVGGTILVALVLFSHAAS